MSNEINDAILYNVIAVTCKVTGYRYVGARKETIEDFRTRVNSDVRTNGCKMLIVRSVQEFGDENHEYRYIARDLPKVEAKLAKSRAIVRDVRKDTTMCLAVPRGPVELGFKTPAQLSLVRFDDGKEYTIPQTANDNAPAKAQKPIKAKA